MKKTLLTAALFMTIMLPATAQKSVPYSSDLGLYDGSTLSLDADWTVIDNNADGKTWKAKRGSAFNGADSRVSGIECPYNSSKASDDWFVSPGIYLEAGNEYKIGFWGNASKYYAKEHYLMSVSTVQSELLTEKTDMVSALTDGTTLLDFDNSMTGWIEYNETYTPATSGIYYFGVKCYSEAGQYYVYATGFSIKTDAFSPAAPSDFSVTRGENRALSAALSWTLPTTASDGAALPDGAVFNSVTVTRDGETIATLDGTATSFEDNASYGLTPGIHTYGVYVTVNSKRSPEVNLTSEFIGDYVAELPWSYSFSDNWEKNEFWTPLQGSSSATGGWEPYSYSKCWRVEAGSSVVTDDWLFTPTVNVTAPGIYRVRLFLGYNSDCETKVDLCLGSGTDIANYTTVATFANVPTTGSDLYGVFYIPEAGQYNLGIHWDDNGTMATNSLRLFSIGMEEWYASPLKATGTGVTVKGANATVFWTNPSKTDIDTDIAALSKVEVYRDNEVIATLTENITPGELSSYKDTPTPGIYTYKVIPYIDEHPATEDPETVTTSWVGPTVQSIPYVKEKMDTEAAYTFVIEDLNADGAGWGYLGGYNMFSFSAGTGEARENSDIIMTPPLDMAAGTYTVTTSMYGAHEGSEIIIGILPADYDVSIVELTQQQKFYLNGALYKGEPQVANFTVTEAGEYRIGIYYKDATQGEDRMIFFPSISVESSTAYPLPVSDMEVKRADDKSLKATISWTNPSESTLANIDPVIKEIVLLRDGVAIQTYPDYPNAGITMSYVDESITEPGMYTYTVEVYGELGKANLPDATVISPWIGTGLAIPYTAGQGKENGFSNWYHSASSTEGTNEFQYEADYLRVNPEAEDVNEIAVSPFFNFESGKDYVVTLKTYNAAASSSRVYLSINEGIDWEWGILSTLQTALETPVDANSYETAQTSMVYVNVKKDSDKIDYIPSQTETEDKVTMEIPSGVYALGFHALTATAGWTLADFSIAEVSESSVKAISDALSFDGNTLILPAGAENVVITDLQGRILSSNAATVDMTHFAHGVYIISATVDGRRVAAKVVK